MKTEWNLDVLYQGYEDPKFTNDLKRFEEICKKLNELASKIQGDEIKVEKAVVNQIVDAWEEKFELESELAIYCGLCQSTNTSDPQSASYLGVISKKSSDCAKAEAVIQKYLAKIEDVDQFTEGDERLTDYRYLLNNLKEEASHLLSNEAEEVVAKMDITGSMAWGNLQEYLTSSVKVDYKGEQKTLSEIRNLAYDEDPIVRKEAYEAELACYDKIKGSIAFALNSIKGQVNELSKLRGYESPLEMTLSKSHMKRATLDAMLSAIQDYLPVFHKYLRKKGEFLGEQKGLSWFNLFAPIGEAEKKYTIEEARDYLISHFSTFSADLTEMVAKAFDEEWIDVYPKSGKVGGAFCCNLQTKKQSRVLTNFDGSLSDIVTLAHELGHAYHNKNIHSHRMFNTDFSMPVADTASSFNENVILNAAMKEANEKDRFALLEGQLQDLTQIICDIYSRYLFETEVFEQSKEKFLFPEELEKIMLESQKKAYGDGLNHDYLHPYMWVCKGHYYSGSTSFYNFPYAFGGLFARGLYARYLEVGEAFLPKYRELLHATTISSVEDVAAYADIDLTKPEFWKDALKQVENQIEEFVRLADKYGKL